MKIALPPEVDADVAERPAVDKQAFADLFNDIPTNRPAIWCEMVKLIRHVAQRDLRVRALIDLDEIKGEALTHAMSIVDRPPGTPGSYDPARRTAYDYFYSVARRHMIHLAKRVRDEPMGEHVADLSFDAMRNYEPRDAARLARSECPRNWNTYRIQNEFDRFRVEKFIRVALRKLDEAVPPSESLNPAQRATVGKQERAARALIGETLAQVKRALLG